MNDLAAPPVSNFPEYTVSEISGAVKRTLEGSSGRVRGEITELMRYPSGHIYSLKGPDAHRRCIGLPIRQIRFEREMKPCPTQRLCRLRQMVCGATRTMRLMKAARISRVCLSPST
jgi:hypothetical protein